jgi:Tfp pilus assembly protein PilE
MPNLRRSQLNGPYSGVTLVEVTISAMILGILAAVASPIYSNSLFRYRADVTAQRIVQDIAQTQRLARQTNSTRTIAFTLADQRYAISGLSSLDRVSQPYQVTVNQAPYRAEFFSLVTAAQPATQLASVTLAFDRFGMPDQGISVTVRAGAFQKRIDVAPTSGRVSVQ